MAKPHDRYFKIFRIYYFINASLLYSIVFFHRNCPSVVSEDMAKDFGKKKSDLGILSSLFFYPYAILQIFAGMISDVMDPAILVGVSHIISSIGGFLCGISGNLGENGGFELAIVGRLLVGLGCGPTYVPICKIASTWFPSKKYGTMIGLLMAFGGGGGIIAQFPLEKFAENLGWQTAFFGISGLGLILSILMIIFCRGTPESRGYEKVNEIESPLNLTIKERLIILGKSFCIIIREKYFWLCSTHLFFKEGPYFDISGLWSGPFLKDVIIPDDYDFHSKSDINTYSGVCLMAFSFGLIGGGLTYPIISNKLKTKKWICVVSVASLCIIYLLISILGKKIHYGVYWVFFFFMSAMVSGSTCITYSLLSEIFEKEIVGSVIGISNFFCFMGSAIYQTISSAIIPKDGEYRDPIRDADAYTETGYRNGLWILSTVSLFVSTVIVIFIKDSMKNIENEEQPNINNNENVQIKSDKIYKDNDVILVNQESNNEVNIELSEGKK